MITLLSLLLSAVLVLCFVLLRQLNDIKASHLRALDRAKADRDEAVAAADASLDAVIQSMEEGFLLLDESGHVRSANHSLQLMFALNTDPAGLTVMEALRSHQIHEIVQRTLTDASPASAEIETRGRHYQVNSARIGSGAGAVLVFHDITRLKHLEETRREFVANVSHELRTPLSIVKGYAETLASGEIGVADTRKFAATIEKHADRLTALVDDLLAIAGLESGRMTLHMQPMTLHGAVEHVCQELATKATARGVRLTNRVSPDQQIHADAQRMQQVLTNLIDNAIKYGSADGEVIISAEARGDEVCILVSDDGPGIPVDARDRVFERFYRLDKARSREEGGTGLGLAIVKHIALAHGGRAWVEESPSGGARFGVGLPRLG